MKGAMWVAMVLFLLLASVRSSSRDDEKKMVAIVMAGHARTYNLTAESWRQRLVLKNPDYAFWFFGLSYSTGERKPALRSTVKAPPIEKKITVDILQKTYEPVVGDARRVVVRVISEEAAEKELLPLKIQRMDRRRLFKTHDKQRKRLSLMFAMVAEAYRAVRAYERLQKRRFDFILKARFDLKLMNDFILKPDFFIDPPTKFLPIVVPLEMAAGPSHFSPKQLSTRPCDLIGSQRPTWVQDHVAYGGSRAMEFYCNGTAKAVFAGPQKRQTRPEIILARALKVRRIQVKCDSSIRYTILR